MTGGGGGGGGGNRIAIEKKKCGEGGHLVFIHGLEGLNMYFFLPPSST